MLITTQFQDQLRNLRRDVHQAGQNNAAVFARSQKLTAVNDNSAPTERLSVNFRDHAPVLTPNGQETDSASDASTAVSESKSSASSGPASSANSSSNSSSSTDATQSRASEQNAMANRTAEQQAAMLAESVKTNEAVRKIYDEMWAELRKSEAQRFQLLMETSRAVSEIIAGSFRNTLATAEAHNKAFLAVIIDAPKD